MSLIYEVNTMIIDKISFVLYLLGMIAALCAFITLMRALSGPF